MRVLYVASNPFGSDSLRLEREITELQGRLSAASGEPLSFIFLPGLAVEELAIAVGRHRPDILHISAHGDHDILSLADGDGETVELDARRLGELLDDQALPTLIYLNACNSHQIAEDLSKLVKMVIGTTASISNRAARAGAVTFYERLLQGRSVESAFRASRAVIEIIESSQTSSKLCFQGGLDPSAIIMHNVPRIVAKFAEYPPKRSKSGNYNLEIGITGCPKSTIQVVIFTDDTSFADESSSLEESLCSICLDRPARGEIWLDHSWNVDGDFKIYACGVTNTDTHFVATSMICDALELHYRSKLQTTNLQEIEPRILEAITMLRQWGGLDPITAAGKEKFA
jgi:hypothetical protein